MSFLKGVISFISSPWDFLHRSLGYVTDLDESINTLKEEMDELKAMTEDEKVKVEAAERQPQLMGSKQVKIWITRAEAAAVDMSDLERCFEEGRSNSGYSFPNVWGKYKLGKRVAEKMEDVRELKKRRVESENVVTITGPETVIVVPCPPSLGMESVFEKVQNWLREDDVGVIGIWGMGGVGKTTLLTRVNNELYHNFDVVILVLVPRELSVEKIQKEIGKRLGFDQDLTVSNISKALSKKKFLLLLDDIWERLDLDAVGIPHPNSQNKSMVVFTTRSEGVCGEMEAKRKIKVECLKENEAWQLFRQKVGEDAMNSHQGIPMLAEDVAKECGGLPLALIAIGRAMAGKKTLEEWKHAKTILRKSQASDFPGMDKVLPLLKLSYESLGNDTIKSCFLYCSLFREGSHIPKDRLIDYWIGEGLIDEYDDIDEARNKGHYFIGTLTDACLLEDSHSYGIKYVKMHDVIRDLALWVASEFGKKKSKILVVSNIGMPKEVEVERWKESRWVSVINSEFRPLPEIQTCPNLSTLTLTHNKRFFKISNNFFQFLPLLRVLDLSWTGLGVLPIGIGKLVALQYLNLKGTRIKKLPCDVGNLEKLKHLDLSLTPFLKNIPHGLISRLAKLEVFEVFGSRYALSKMEDSGGDGSEVDLGELEGLEYLDHLGVNISTDIVLKKFFQSDRFQECTMKLQFQRSEVPCVDLSSTFQNFRNVQQLNFYECPKLEELMIDADVENKDRLLSRLEILVLFRLKNLNKILVPSGFLKNLSKLWINKCVKLMDVTWIVHLHVLEEIVLLNCHEMEQVIGACGADGRDEELTLLPRLKRIVIINLPKLQSICMQTSAFPSLKYLEVMECPELKKLPLGPDNANNTSSLIINGTNEWWDGLEWEVEGIKSIFDPCFVGVGRRRSRLHYWSDFMVGGPYVRDDREREQILDHKVSVRHFLEDGE